MEDGVQSDALVIARARRGEEPAFAELLLPFLERLPADVDALLPVPLHRWRQTTRGFNQARELCRPLARHTGLPLIQVARRCRATRFQSGLTAAERRRNLRKAFRVVPSWRRRHRACRHIVIVDDVITTGETTRHLARSLLASGVEQVSALAVARAL